MPRPEVSQAAEMLYERLWPHTIEDEANEWHLLLFCEALAGTLFEQVRSYVSDRDGMLGWEIIFNADECPAEALPYLAQFVGVHFEDSLTEQEQREKIKDRPAFRRGTVGAMEAAAKRWLTGDKFVYITERFEGNAYRLFVRTFDSETPDPAKVLAELLSQKPAGIVMLYEAVTSKTYQQVKTDYGTYKVMKEQGSYAEAIAP